MNTIQFLTKSSNDAVLIKTRLLFNHNKQATVESIHNYNNVIITVPCEPGAITVEISIVDKESTTALTITGALIDGIRIPDWYIWDYSSLKINETMYKSQELRSNQTWSFNAHTPIITWILDQKIIHEAKYNQDYNFPWAYKLGPDSVSRLSKDFDYAIKLINTTL